MVCVSFHNYVNKNTKGCLLKMLYKCKNKTKRIRGFTSEALEFELTLSIEIFKFKDIVFMELYFSIELNCSQYKERVQ